MDRICEEYIHSMDIQRYFEACEKLSIPLSTLQKTHNEMYRQCRDIQSMFDYIAVEYIHQAFHTLRLSTIEDITCLSQNQILTPYVINLFPSLPWSCLYLGNNPGLSVSDILEIQPILTNKSQIRYLTTVVKDPTMWCDIHGTCYGIPEHVKTFPVGYGYNPHWYDIHQFRYPRMRKPYEESVEQIQETLKELDEKTEYTYQDTLRCKGLSSHPLITWDDVRTYDIPWCRRRLLKNPMLTYIETRWNDKK